MKPVSKQDYEANLRRLAVEAFKDHDRLVEVGPGHWRINNTRLGSIFWADIVILGGCAVAVWGDIAAVVFAYGAPVGKDRSPEAILRWIAGSDLDYARQKACIGMSHVGSESTDPGVALSTIDYHLEEAEREEGGLCEEDYALKRARNDLQDGSSVEEVRQYLYDNGVDSETAGSIGDVVAPRVVYALEAVNRLVAMIDAATRPEECRPPCGSPAEGAA